MSTRAQRVAILFPADSDLLLATSLEKSRFAETAAALRAAGLEVIAAPYTDEIATEVRERLSTVDGVMVWFNPIERGRDRTVLNAMLREVASQGAFVSAHPDVIDRIGTKEVLYRTRSMGWGCDTSFYETADAMRSGLPKSLRRSGKRVLKQIRGQSGDGIWLVAPEDDRGAPTTDYANDALLRVRHAKRGSPEEVLTLEAFLTRCSGYFTAAGGMIDQAYQPRLPEGMVRCYLVADRVAGFGEQLINALYPAAPGAAAHTAPEPGPRLYYPPTRADFQRLKDMLERQWLDELCTAVGIEKRDLPLLWDADFLYGAKDADGADTYVLCEINVSSVYPFPDDALVPLAMATRARLAERR
jgi:hypothetical protein